MKKTLLALLLCFSPAIFVACTTSPSTQTTEYKTLATLAVTAKAGMDSATALLASNKITVEQWHRVAAFYDSKWQPIFNTALTLARSDLSSVASPDVAAVAAQLASLVASLTTK